MSQTQKMIHYPELHADISQVTKIIRNYKREAQSIENALKSGVKTRGCIRGLERAREETRERIRHHENELLKLMEEVECLKADMPKETFIHQ